MRKFTASIPLLAALALGACGEEKGPTVIPPPNQIEDPLAYFGMAPCTCYEYAPAKEWEEGEETFTRKLGVAVENVSGSTRLGRDYHRVRYRIAGTPVREEYLDPTDPDLLVAGVNPTGVTNDPIVRLDPPASLVRGPVESGVVVRSEAASSLVSPTETEEGPEVVIRAQYRDEEDVEIGSWDEVTEKHVRETITATPIGYSGASGLDNGQVRWFVPERGFVKLRVELEGETSDWVLIKTRQLDESCDPEGGPAEPVDHCGI